MDDRGHDGDPRFGVEFDSDPAGTCRSADLKPGRFAATETTVVHVKFLKTSDGTASIVAGNVSDPIPPNPPPEIRVRIALATVREIIDRGMRFPFPCS